MKVEIYADIICPWCYIGEHRFAQALRSFEHADDVEVTFRPFQLDPDAPERGVPVQEYLQKRYGTRSRSMIRAAEDAAHAEGLPIHYGSAIIASTLAAHRVLILALEEFGASVQRSLMNRLYEAHFAGGEDVGDHDVLLSYAKEVGMKEERAREYLESGEGEDALRLALRHAQELGIRAVPTFVIDGKFAVQGAQPPSTLLQVLNEVAAESVRGV